jgi:glycerophosphoryl diester phosphodiesterase
MEDRYIEVLKSHRYTQTAPLEIQSFEVSNLKYMRERLGRAPNLRIMQLVSFGPGPAGMPGDAYASQSGLTYEIMITSQGMKDIAKYADVVAPNTRMVIPLDANQRMTQPTALVSHAHNAGLLVHTWTFRPENRFLAADYRNNAGENARNEQGSIAEMQTYLQAGIDGFFSDDSELGRKAIDTFSKS